MERIFCHDAKGTFPWRPGEEFPSDRIELSAMAPTLAEVDRALGAWGIRTLITDKVGGELPLRGLDLIVFCVIDELAAPVAYSTEVGLVAKPYGVSRPALPNLRGFATPIGRVAAFADEARQQQRRLNRVVEAQRRRSVKHPVVDIPLGQLIEFASNDSSTTVHERPYDVTFMGSVSVGDERKNRITRSAKSYARTDLIRALHRYQIQHPRRSIETLVHGDYHDAQKFRGEYSSKLVLTRIAPCPRGNSLETYRFYEAMAAGCIVATGPLPNRGYYTGAPVLSVRDWSKFPAMAEGILSDSDAMARLQVASREWWRDKCAPSSIARRVVAAYRSSWQSDG